MSMTHLKVQGFTGDTVKPYIPDLARLRIEVFREYPYLYEGTVEYEEKYLKRFIQYPDAILVLVFDGDRIVGASTGSPLEYAHDFQAPLKKAGISIADYFYCGESVLEKKYRGRGIGNQFFDFREAHAKKIGRFRYSCFCAVERPKSDPKRPVDYRPLDDFWGKRGYIKHPELVAHFSWPEVGTEEETEKPLVFWIKNLSE